MNLDILIQSYISRSSHRNCSIKKGVLKNFVNSQKNTCARVSLLIQLHALVCNIIEKDTPAQVICCELCEILRPLF